MFLVPWTPSSWRALSPIRCWSIGSFDELGTGGRLTLAFAHTTNVITGAFQAAAKRTPHIPVANDSDLRLHLITLRSIDLAV